MPSACDIPTLFHVPILCLVASPSSFMNQFKIEPLSPPGLACSHFSDLVSYQPLYLIPPASLSSTAVLAPCCPPVLFKLGSAQPLQLLLPAPRNPCSSSGGLFFVLRVFVEIKTSIIVIPHIIPFLHSSPLGLQAVPLTLLFVPASGPLHSLFLLPGILFHPLLSACSRSSNRM